MQKGLLVLTIGKGDGIKNARYVYKELLRNSHLSIKNMIVGY